MFQASPLCFLLLSSLEFSDTQVYEPLTRALLGNASRFCEVVVFKCFRVHGPGVTSVGAVRLVDLTLDGLALVLMDKLHAFRESN